MKRDECEHGSLRRSCEICELKAELAEDKREIDKWYKKACAWQSNCEEHERKNIALTAENERLKGELARAREAVWRAYQHLCSSVSHSREPEDARRILKQVLKESGYEIPM